MIVSLSVRDFLLVDRLDLEPDPGFTALTGETGAGKSIILDALAMALGGVAERRMIRPGADMSSVAVEFSLPPDHAVWRLLGDAGVSVSESETLTLKRIVKPSGPSRALLNDQPVSAGLLASVGASLVEIHGQHASAALWRVSAHRDLLDQYAGNESLLNETAKAWGTLKAARETHARLATESAGLDAMRETLQADIVRLQELAPVAGEADRLAEERSCLMQAERVGEALSLARAALEDGNMVARLGQAAREIDRVARLPGFDEPGSPARLAADALERTLIEVQESETAIEALAGCAEHDPERLETVESRLFALRAAARRHGVDVEALPETLADFLAQLETLGADGEAVEAAARAEREAAAAYHGAAGRLTAARKAAGERLSGAIGDELKPLKLDHSLLCFRHFL